MAGTDFHEVSFPLRLALTTGGGPVRRTEIVRLTNGHENRNARWRDARRSYDAGCGVRSVDDLYEVLAFFEARRGELHGFRFRDPVDNRSTRPDEPVTAGDQVIGVGDGMRTTFALVKTYGDAGGATTRRIDKPVAGSVRLAIDGTDVAAANVSVDHAAGLVTFEAAAIPASGAIVTAGYEFDVPVRFATERLDINLTAFRAGQIPTIPLIEIKP
jgi:uncharacterized protein (TIGR02217 family)